MASYDEKFGTADRFPAKGGRVVRGPGNKNALDREAKIRADESFDKFKKSPNQDTFREAYDRSKGTQKKSFKKS